MKKFYVVMAVVITVLVVLNIAVSGVGAATTQTPQQMKAILFKDVKAMETNENTKTCHKLSSDAWNFEHAYKPVNSIVSTIWAEMTADLNIAGHSDCNDVVYDGDQKKDIKGATYRSHELDVRFAEGQGVQQYAK